MVEGREKRREEAWWTRLLLSVGEGCSIHTYIFNGLGIFFFSDIHQNGDLAFLFTVSFPVLWPVSSLLHPIVPTLLRINTRIGTITWGWDGRCVVF